MAVTDPFLIAADIFDPPPDPYAADPVEWAHDILGLDLWSKQREIVESVRDHPATAVRSGNGCGKTTTAAATALWFLDTHLDSRVITTATKWSQVEKLLWHEVGQLHAQGRRRPQAQGRPIFRVGKDQPLKTEIHLPDGRYGIGLSSKPENSESFAGHHAPHILVIYDEASGIPPKIFEVGDGYLTTAGAKALLIGNPTRTSGVFFDAFHTQRALYNCIHISVLDAPAFTGEPVSDRARAALSGPEFVESMKKKWGEDSPVYAIRVKGEFAKTSTDTVIDLALIEDAQLRELPPATPIAQEHAVIGIDVARFGDDETVISTRHGNQIRIREAYVGNPTTHTRARAIHWWKVLRDEAKADPIFVVDDDGVGGGVTDMLREKEYEVVAFNGGARAIEADSYPNRRSEVWFQMKRRLPSLDLDEDDQLAADLVAPKFKYDSDNRRVVERKDETKKRLGRSPDRGDSALLTIVKRRVAGLPGEADRSPAPREELAGYDAPAPRGGTLTSDLLTDEM